MTTTKENKVLTVSQYEFYKKGDTPMADTAIGKIYGMNPNQLNAFKQENGLIGKYRKKTPWQENGNSALYTGKKVDIQPLREKHIIAASSSSVDSKTPTISQVEVMERHNSQESGVGIVLKAFSDNNDKLTAKDLDAANEALGNELEKRVDLDKFQHEENQEYIAELLDEVADKAEKIEEERENARGWEEKYKKEYECSAMWRDRFLDMERQKNKLEQTVSVEISNRKYAEKLMDETLIAKYQDEQLSVMLAAKFVDVSKRNLEGERV